FEHLAAAATKVPLDSQRGVTHAAEAVAEAAICQEQALGRLHDLMGALTTVRERNEKSAAELETRRAELEARRAQLAQLLERMADVGSRAKEVSDAMSGVRLDEPGGEAAQEVVLARIRAQGERVAGIADDARSLAQAAQAAHFGDLAQKADSLRQQLLAAKN